MGAKKTNVNVSKALVYAHNDSHFRILKNSTTGVMFFGTPHRGSESINYRGVLQKLADITAMRDISVMKELQRDSDTLARLTLESRRQLSRYKVISFYETLQTVIGPFTSLVKCSVNRNTSDILTYLIIDCRQTFRSPGYGLGDSNSSECRSSKYVQVLIP